MFSAQLAVNAEGRRIERGVSEAVGYVLDGSRSGSGPSGRLRVETHVDVFRAVSCDDLWRDRSIYKRGLYSGLAILTNSTISDNLYPVIHN